LFASDGPLVAIITARARPPVDAHSMHSLPYLLPARSWQTRAPLTSTTMSMGRAGITEPTIELAKFIPNVHPLAPDTHWVNGSGMDIPEWANLSRLRTLKVLVPHDPMADA